jgi:hypothetical protein
MNGDAAMSEEHPADAHRRRTDLGGHSQTDQPWKGNPEKEQKPGTKKPDPDQWQETNTHEERG